MAEPLALPRIDGAAVWQRLPPHWQALIGACAVELAAAWAGIALGERTRPHEMAAELLEDRLSLLVEGMAPELLAEPTPIPSQLGMVCTGCGCSQYDPCADGCGWAMRNLCTACASCSVAGVHLSGGREE
jgi:hypothetical protein